MLPLDGIMTGKNPTKEQNLDLRNRLVSFIHGFMAFGFAGYAFITMRTECGELNNLY